LYDGNMHLSGAFQMAGMPNVVGTSWALLDDAAASVATGF